MRDLVNILQQTFTKEFYRLNAMFFLLVCGLAFGFMSGVEHKALAEFITSGPIMTLIPVSLWILYGIKIYSFNNQVCRMREMNFVHLLSLTPSVTQFFCAISVVANQFFPAIGYGVFLIIIAIKNQSFIAAFCIVASLLLLILAFSFLLYHRIGSIEAESRASFLKKWMDKNFEKSFVQFFVEWLMRNHPGIIIFTKLFGCFLLFGVCQLYRYDEYDYRLLALGCLTSFGGSMVIAHHYVLFENHLFQILRNLPLTLTKRMIYFALSMTFLCLPEFIVLTRNFPVQLAAHRFVELAVFAMSLLILGYAIQLIINKELGLAKNENPIQGSFIIEELTDLVEEAVLTEFDRITERGGVLGAMETMYQRGKIQEESLYYETLKHTGEYPIIGVNTFLSSKGSPTVVPREVIRATTEEKEYQIKMLRALHTYSGDKVATHQNALQEAAVLNKNIFEELMESCKVCSLGQITKTLFEVGGQYRRNM